MKAKPFKSQATRNPQPKPEFAHAHPYLDAALGAFCAVGFIVAMILLWIFTGAA